MTIVGNRITDDLYACFPDSQAAYQPGRGTIEQIFALNQMIEKSVEFNKPIYVIFIDFTKAFDSIKLDKLWSILNKTPLNKNYTNLSAILFRVALAAVMLKAEESCNSGFSIGGHIISNLSYADDIALTNECPIKLQLFVNQLTINAK